MADSAIRAYATYNRLRGHALRGEGHLYERSDEEYGYVRSWHGWSGVGLCECGETSAWLDTNNARKRWHRDVHKPEVRARMEAER